MAEYELVKINYTSTCLLSKFLTKLGEGGKKFRYFQKRDFSVLKNHLVTMLLISDERPIAYGHLDKEKEQVWLGIAVAQDYHGLGYGKIIMENLFKEASVLNCNEINLTVDLENIAAISLYRKFGFVDVKKYDNHIHLRHTSN